MNQQISLLNNLSEKQKEFIKSLTNETLEKVFQDREEALRYARKGIIQNETDQPTQERIELIADCMQILARMVLEERGILGKS